MALYEEKIALEAYERSYPRLCKIVTAHLERKRLVKNRQEMKEGLEGKGFTGKVNQPGDCRQFMKKGNLSNLLSPRLPHM